MTLDSRELSGALSLIRPEAWPQELQVLNVVRWLTIESGGAETALAFRSLGNWIGVGPSKAGEILGRLVDLRVLARTEEGGRRAWRYRLRDPREWLDVPWVIPGRAPDGRRAPELVMRRLDKCSEPIKITTTHVVTDLTTGEARATTTTARRSALDHARNIEDRAEPLPGDRAQDSELRAAPGEEIARNAPSSSGGQPGRVAARVGRGEEEEANRGSIVLEGAAKTVAGAILTQGVGGLADSLRAKLNRAFASRTVEEVEHILAAIPGHARVCRSPQLVQTAIDMLELTEAPPAPDPDPTSLSDLLARRSDLEGDLAAARREGDDGMADMFARQLAECENRIQQKRARRTA